MRVCPFGDESLEQQQQQFFFFFLEMEFSHVVVVDLGNYSKASLHSDTTIYASSFHFKKI
jgi:hypothetical protein